MEYLLRKTQMEWTKCFKGSENFGLLDYFDSKMKYTHISILSYPAKLATSQNTKRDFAENRGVKGGVQCQQILKQCSNNSVKQAGAELCQAQVQLA